MIEYGEKTLQLQARPIERLPRSGSKPASWQDRDTVILTWGPSEVDSEEKDSKAFQEENQVQPLAETALICSFQSVQAEGRDTEHLTAYTREFNEEVRPSFTDNHLLKG